MPILSICRRRRESRGCSHRLRHGRLLVECLVAMLLVNATALATISLARSASSSVRRARLTSSAWALATRRLESSRVDDCPAGAIAGIEASPPMFGTWSDHLHAGWRERSLQVSASPSPWSGSAMRISMSAAWSCP